jgi:hypothetical protein
MRVVGPLWQNHRRHFGKDHDPILVWQSPSKAMNPTIPDEVITEELVPAATRVAVLINKRDRYGPGWNFGFVLPKI